MNPVRSITRRVRVGRLLGVILAVYFTGTMVQLAAAQLVLPDIDGKHRELRREQAPPFPEAGETASFRYARDQGDMYRITPTDGSQSYLVSASFLRTTLNNSQLDNSQQAELLQAHTALMQEMFRTTYPDGAVQYKTPFTPQSFKSTDGTQVRLEQDPVAAPYVRVWLTGGEGPPEEFSIARGTVEQMLANKRTTDDRRLEGLRSFPFRLPEAARAGDFSRVSAAELARLVQQKPGLRQHQFVRMAPFSAETQRQAAAPPSGAPHGVPQSADLAQLPVQAPALGSNAPSGNRLSKLVAGTLRAEAMDAHGVPTSAWWRSAPYIIALSLLVFGLVAMVMSVYRR